MHSPVVAALRETSILFAVMIGWLVFGEKMTRGKALAALVIVGGVMLGVDKRAAAEFSFFLAIPTMVGAFAKDFWESRESLMEGSHLGLLAVGFIVSFLSGLVVVKVLLDIVSKRGLSPFGWWRILVGGGGLAVIYLT